MRRWTDFRAGLYETRSVTQRHGTIKFSRTHRREPMSQVDEDSVSCEQGTASELSNIDHVTSSERLSSRPQPFLFPLLHDRCIPLYQNETRPLSRPNPHSRRLPDHPRPSTRRIEKHAAPRSRCPLQVEPRLSQDHICVGRIFTVYRCI